MKTVLAKKMDVPFTQIANSVLNDRTISWKAKGLFSYIHSKPIGWEFAAERISGDGNDGVDSVSAGLKELEERGYLSRKKRADGKVDYEIRWKPERENPIQGKSLTGKIPLIINKEGISNKERIQDAAQSAAPPRADSFFQKTKKERLDSGVGMSLPEFVLMCRGSQWRHVRLIGEYADERKIAFDTRGQWREFGRRNLQVARRLSPFTDRQLADAIRRMHEDLDAISRRDGKSPKWGMETIEKYLVEANAN